MFAWIELTPSCNLRCVHCYVNYDFEANDGRTQIRFNPFVPELIDNLAKVGCKMVQFIGGEPLLLKTKLEEYIKLAKSKNMEVEVYSNLTLLDKNENLVNFFKEYGVYVATSFYSYDENTHDRITQKPGSFRKTLEAIKKVLSEGIDVRVGIVIIKNLNDQHIKDTIRFLQKLEIKKTSIRVDNIREVGTEKTCDVENSCLPGKACFPYNGYVFPCIFFRNIILGKYPEDSFDKIMSNLKKFWLQKMFSEKNIRTAEKFISRLEIQQDLAKIGRIQ